MYREVIDIICTNLEYGIRGIRKEMANIVLSYVRAPDARIITYEQAKSKVAYVFEQFYNVVILIYTEDELAQLPDDHVISVLLADVDELRRNLIDFYTKIGQPIDDE